MQSFFMQTTKTDQKAWMQKNSFLLEKTPLKKELGVQESIKLSPLQNMAKHPLGQPSTLIGFFFLQGKIINYSSTKLTAEANQ